MNKHCYSYHIFYFPFKWHLPEEEKKLLSEQVDLKHIPVETYSMWERRQITRRDKTILTDEKALKDAQELFGEQQYYFDFVHPVLYDIKNEPNPIISHYERREPQENNVEYCIKHKNKEYILRIDAINLNLYATGVGVLSFYLANELEEQKGESAIRDINQYGRRIMPPHCGEFTANHRNMLAECISLKGLHNDVNLRYTDSYDYSIDGKSQFGLSDTWQPATFIRNLIEDLSPSLIVIPIIDDRMLVNCWYSNNDLAMKVKSDSNEFINSDFWYKYVFVDSGDNDYDVTCQNKELRTKLIKESTYERWQKFGTLYGITRYSMVALTDEGDFAKNCLSMHMRTIYSRMFELAIIQRASMLRFSGEVTRVSVLEKGNKIIAERIGSIYKEYIRFVNQIYFRSVTAQDQGIEMYNLLMKQLNTKEQIKDLDIDLVVGPAMGGVIVSYELGRQLNKETVFTERKDGVMELRRGFEVKPGAKIIIAEDVVTTGKSTIETKEALEKLGGEVIGVACIANRTSKDIGMPIYSAIKLDIQVHDADECPLCKEGNIELVKPGSREFKELGM